MPILGQGVQNLKNPPVDVELKGGFPPQYYTTEKYSSVTYY